MAESQDPNASPHAALVGTSIANGRFVIVSLLGEGGMGAVYEARQQPMDRRVALKLIHPTLGRSVEAVARFQREMRVTTRVEHENTVRVYDFGESEGRLFLAMEFLEGRTLSKVLSEAGRLPPARALHLADQVLRGLAAAHHQELVHRDLKPENIMVLDRVGEADVVKVVDFGIAKSLDDQNTQMTAAGGVIGTPRYMSPEQAMGRPIDARSDLYSFGVVLYEMLSGTAPFTSPSVSGLIVAHATELPVPLGTLVPSLPPALCDVVMQLLEKDPAARPQTAHEAQALLAASVLGDTTARSRALPPTRVRQPATMPDARSSLATLIAVRARQPRVLAATAALVVLAIIAWRVLGAVRNPALDAFAASWQQAITDQEGQPISQPQKDVIAEQLDRLRSERDVGLRDNIFLTLVARLQSEKRHREVIALCEAMRLDPPTPRNYNYSVQEIAALNIITAYQLLNDNAAVIRSGEAFVLQYPASTYLEVIQNQVNNARKASQPQAAPSAQGKREAK